LNPVSLRVARTNVYPPKSVTFGMICAAEESGTQLIKTKLNASLRKTRLLTKSGNAT
jgi:hypothetical protein